MKVIRRSQTHNAPPMLKSQSATLDECSNLKSHEWKWLERKAFIDTVGNRLLWLGLSNCAHDTLHILDLSATSRNDGQWIPANIPRNARKDLAEIGHRHVSRVAYLQSHQRFFLFLNEIPDQAGTPLSKTCVWSVPVSKEQNSALTQGWSLVGEVPNSEIVCVSGGQLNDIYCLNRTTSDHHQGQSIIRLFWGMPSLKSLSLNAMINALDPKTKKIQKKHLVEQLGKNIPSQTVESLWYRTKLDRGVLRYLSKGMGFYGEYAKDDDQVSFWKKLASRFSG